MLLAQRLHHFMVPAPNRARASNFSTFSQTSVILFPFFFFFLLLAILVGVKRSLLWFGLHPLTISDGRRPSCASWPLARLLWRNLYSSPPPFSFGFVAVVPFMTE